MGQFDSIVGLFTDLGKGVNSIVNTEYTLYAAYFIAFFAVIYQLIYIGINHGKFQGKPARVISIMLSIMISGGIFYKKSSNDIVTLFGNVAGSIIAIALCSALIFFAIKMHLEHRQSHPHGMFLLLTSTIYISTSILLPHIKTLTEKITSLGVIYTTLLTLNSILLIVVMFALVRFIFSFNSGNSTVGKRMSQELQQTSQLRNHTNNLNAQLAQGEQIVNQLERLTQNG